MWRKSMINIHALCRRHTAYRRVLVTSAIAITTIVVYTWKLPLRDSSSGMAKTPSCVKLLHRCEYIPIHINFDLSQRFPGLLLFFYEARY